MDIALAIMLVLLCALPLIGIIIGCASIWTSIRVQQPEELEKPPPPRSAVED